MDAMRTSVFERFKRQYLQLVDLQELAWPTKDALRPIEAQTWLYNNLFNTDMVMYRPPKRYQFRVLKKLLHLIEDSIEDPDEDDISDDLSSTLALLMSQEQPTEAAAAQQPSYVTYLYSSKGHIMPRVTILESPSIIASAGTTGRRTWEAALHLSKYLIQVGDSVVRGKRVLELGAGTGLVSILCARWLGAQHVTATDGDDRVVEDLQRNILLNELENTGKMYAKSLKWRGRAIEENEGGSPPNYDVVLGADITYEVSVIPTLVATFRELFILNSKVDILIAATIRNPETFSTFTSACGTSNFSVFDMEYPVQPTALQDGPFYAATCPIRIVRITATRPIRDPFAI